jgi:hypothetical protein
MLGKLMFGTLMFGTSMMSGTVDVRDVKVDVAGHAWHLEATFGGAPPPTRWPTGLRAGPSPGTRFRRLDRAVLRAGHRRARITRRSPNTEAWPMADTGQPEVFCGWVIPPHSGQRYEGAGSGRRGAGSEECPPAEGWARAQQ